jgi:hypothetical protein
MSIRRDRSQADRLREQLLGPKRHDVLSLDEVLQAGRILFGDPQGMSFYGLPPVAWYARGVRLLGRTSVEATPDVTAQSIARTVRALLGRRPRVGVIDLFAGPGNLMVHVAEELFGRSVRPRRGRGRLAAKRSQPAHRRCERGAAVRRLAVVLCRSVPC